MGGAGATLTWVEVGDGVGIVVVDGCGDDGGCGGADGMVAASVAVVVVGSTTLWVGGFDLPLDAAAAAATATATGSAVEIDGVASAGGVRRPPKSGDRIGSCSPVSTIRVVYTLISCKHQVAHSTLDNRTLYDSGLEKVLRWRVLHEQLQHGGDRLCRTNHSTHIHTFTHIVSVSS